MAKHHSDRNSPRTTRSGASEASQPLMTAFFVTISTSIRPNQLAGARRRLAGLLADHGIRLRAVRRQKAVVPAVVRALKDRPKAPLAVIDEKTANPAEAAWLRELLGQAVGLQGGVVPQVIYITRQATPAGTAVAQTHPLLRGNYVQRDDKGLWLDTVADRIIELLRTPTQTGTPTAFSAPPDIPGIVGMSHCFREAVRKLVDLFDAPCGLVTGEEGVGKMSLIRSLHRYRFPDGRWTVLPCGVFFKDYFVGGSHRVLAGGADAADLLGRYLEEAEGGVLVLHHIERLPTGVQDELASVLEESAANMANPREVQRVDREGLQVREVRVIATSTLLPELLARTGRMLPELVRRLSKNHVRVPSLRERGREDVRLLANAILQDIAARAGRPSPDLDDEALAALQRSAWPKNITDLRQALDEALRECRQGQITRDDLPKWLSTSRKGKGPLTLDEIVAQTQRTVILSALDYTGGDIVEAARMLGRNSKGLYRLMKSLGLKTRHLRTELIRRRMRL